MSEEWSSVVRATLSVGSMTIELSHVGPEWVMARYPQDVPIYPGAVGVLAVVVDDSRVEHRVRLPDGIGCGSRRIAYER